MRKYKYLPIYGTPFDNGGWKNNWQNGNWAGSAAGMAGTAASIFGSAYKMATPNTDSVESKVETELEALKSQKSIGQFNSLDDLMAGWAANKRLDTSYDSEDYYNGPSTGDIITGTLSSTVSGATAGSMAGPWGALAGAVVGLGSGLIGGLIGKNKAQDAANSAAAKLSREARETNNYRQAAFQTMAQNMTTKNDRNMFASVAAYGGPLGISLTPVNGAIDYMQNEELLALTGENKTKDNNMKTSYPLFAFGGALGGYGGTWSDGLNFIKAGGTHGQNPIGGVPMGMAQDGQPNLVEEGEVIWNDYVFSNRIKMPKKLADKYKLKGDPTFAMGVEQIQKNSSERPNDPIEKRGLEAVLAEFMGEQEMIRQRKAEREYQKGLEASAAYAAYGGPKGKYSVEGSIANMYTPMGQILNSMNPYTATMNASRNSGEYLQNLDAASDLAHKASYAIAPLLILGAPAESEAVFQDILLGHNYAGALGGGLLAPIARDFHHATVKNNKSKEANKNVNHRRIGLEYEDGGPIHIAKNKKGTFTAAATKHGMGVQEFASHVLANKDKFSPAMVKKANFARNASRWQHAYGGPLGHVFEGEGGETQQLNLPTSGWQTALRYAPLLGGISILTDAFGWTNKPDYQYADAIDQAAKEASTGFKHVSPTYLGDYLAYNPFDRMFYANELGAQQAATRSAIINQSNGNAGQAMAGLLAAGYNGNVGLGKLFREGEEYNLGQRQAVAEFNRATHQYNSEADLKAQIANAEQDRLKSSLIYEAAVKSNAMRQAEDQLSQANKMANITTFLDNLGAVGSDFTQQYWLNALANSGVFGTLNDSMLGIMTGGRRARSGACGGKLPKKKKGLTI